MSACGRSPGVPRRPVGDRCTLVSPLRADGGCARVVSLLEAAQQREVLASPGLSGERGRAKLVLAGEIGGRFFEEAHTFFRLLTRTKIRSVRTVARWRLVVLDAQIGLPCLLAPRLAQSLCRCSIAKVIQVWMAATPRLSLTSSGTFARHLSPRYDVENPDPKP